MDTLGVVPVHVTVGLPDDAAVAVAVALKALTRTAPENSGPSGVGFTPPVRSTKVTLGAVRAAWALTCPPDVTSWSIGPAVADQVPPSFQNEPAMPVATPASNVAAVGVGAVVLC